jgi:serine/threonine protein kinase
MESSGHAKLMDFGIAHTMSGQESSEQVLGTGEYMAPERCLSGEIDGRSDIYSLGVMAYELLTGEIPFQNPDPYEILRAHVEDPMPDLLEKVPGTDADLVSFIEKACRKDPAERYATGAEILEHFSQGEQASRRGKSVTILYDGYEQSLVQEAIATLEKATSMGSSIRVIVNELGEIE